MTRFVTRDLAGWGRHPVQECLVARPEKRRELNSAITEHEPGTLLARGLGRSYGDAALNENSGVLLQERLNRFLSFDDETGVLECEGGASFADIIETFGSRGWFLPVTPGTKFVTVGGAIACDIHGKNHHRDGTIAPFIESLDLLTGDGRVLRCSREENSEAFWATIGGLGLTGIITHAKLKLRRVASAYMKVDYERLPNLDAALERFGQDAQYSYSVAWIDCLASGESLGRSVLIRGEHAQPSDLDANQQQNPLQSPPGKKRGVPLDFPDFALNPLTVRAFNAAYYAAHPTKQAVSDWDTFFYPLDAVQGWNRIYGARGFIQYQVVLPYSSSRAGLIELLEKLAASGRASFLAVLKTFGEPNQAPLSFPFAGHTLALDLPWSDDLPEFVQALDEIVLRHEGRVYLAKDALLSPPSFREMYPRWPQWLETKRKLDPDGVFSSSLARRLEMLEGRDE